MATAMAMAESSRPGRLGAALAAASLALGAAAGCESRNEFAPPPPPAVSVANPITRPVADTVEFTGSTESRAHVDLRARVNGYLQDRHFEDGANVKKGELLFTIEPEPYEIRLERAKADLQKAEAGLELAKAEVARTGLLLQRQASSRQEYDVDVAERNTAAAEVASAKAAVRDAELQLSYTEVRAPLDGRIGRRLVDVGNLVQAETTLLATIDAYDPIYVYFTLSESQLLYFTRLRQEEKLPPLGSEPIPLQMALGDEEGYPHEGLFDFAEAGVDPSTGTALRRGVFPNPDGSLVPGLYARIRAQVGRPAERLLVPERALGADQQGRYALVVNAEDVVEYRSVRPGIKLGGMRVIEAGLQPDDRVVVNGLLRARPGAKVAPELVPIDEPGVPTPAEPAATAAASVPAEARDDGPVSVRAATGSAP